MTAYAVFVTLVAIIVVGLLCLSWHSADKDHAKIRALRERAEYAEGAALEEGRRAERLRRRLEAIQAACEEVLP